MPLEPSDVAALRAAEQALIAWLEAADPWVEHYTRDATFALPGSPTGEGRGASLAMARAMTRSPSASGVARRDGAWRTLREQLRELPAQAGAGRLPRASDARRPAAYICIAS